MSSYHRGRPQLGVNVDEEASLREVDVRENALIRHWRGPGITKKQSKPTSAVPVVDLAASMSHLTVSKGGTTRGASPHHSTSELTQPKLPHTDSTVEGLNMSMTNGGLGSTSPRPHFSPSSTGIIQRSTPSPLPASMRASSQHQQQPPAAIRLSNKAATILDNLLGPGRWRGDPSMCAPGSNPNVRHVVPTRAGTLPAPSTLVPVVHVARTSNSTRGRDASLGPSLTTLDPSEIHRITVSAAQASSDEEGRSYNVTPLSTQLRGGTASSQAELVSPPPPPPKLLSPLEQAVSHHHAERTLNRVQRKVKGPTLSSFSKGTQDRKLAPVSQRLSDLLSSSAPATEATDGDELRPDWSTPDVPHVRAVSTNGVGGGDLQPKGYAVEGSNGAVLAVVVHDSKGVLQQGPPLSLSSAGSHSRTRYQLVPGTWSTTPNNSALLAVSRGADMATALVTTSNNLGKGTVGVGPKAASQIERERNREIRAEFMRSHPQRSVDDGPLTAIPNPTFVSVEDRRAEAQERLLIMTEEARAVRASYRQQLQRDQRLETEAREKQQLQVQKDQRDAKRRKEERRAELLEGLNVQRERRRVAVEMEKEEADNRQEALWQEYQERREQVAAAREASTLRQMEVFGDKKRAAAAERARSASKASVSAKLIEESRKLTRLVVQRDKAIHQNATVLAEQRCEEAKQRSVAQVRVDREENAAITQSRKKTRLAGVGRGTDGGGEDTLPWAAPITMTSLQNDPAMPA